jgi:hydroxyacylglutathione hydrolase
LVTSFPAVAFGTNCYLVAAGPGEECIVVDPGIGVVRQLDETMVQYHLRPVAVLLTHGHIDHTFSVAPVCGARGITAYIHPDDRELLADPAKGFSREAAEIFSAGLLPYAEPADVAELPDNGTITVAGLEITVDHAPGHTPGSVLFRLPGGVGSTGGAGGGAGVGGGGRAGDGGVGRVGSAGAVRVDAGELCLTGDVLFAGSIGRTDLPGGSWEAMLRSLREKILPLADDTVVLPGHGPASTIGRERATNPYLREASAATAK